MDDREPQATGTSILPVTTSATINEQKAPEVATIDRESATTIQTETTRKRGRPKNPLMCLHPNQKLEKLLSLLKPIRLRK